MERRRAPALTERERALLRRLAEGEGVAELGARLHLPAPRVRGLLRRLGEKLLVLGAPRRPRVPVRRAGRGERAALVGGRADGERLLRRTLRAAAKGGRAVSAVLVQVAEPPAAGGAPGSPAAAGGAARGATRLLRQSDWAAAWDRDALLAVLPDTDLEGARAVAERLRGEAGRGGGAFAAAAEWQPPETAAALVARLERAVNEERTRRSLERTLWGEPEGYP